jgi:hypothetical protein
MEKLTLSALFLTSIFWSVLALSEPFDMSGKWAPSQEIGQSYSLEVVIQRALSSADKEKLSQLQASGFSCVHQNSSTYRCRRANHAGWETPEGHRKLLTEQFSNISFEFVSTPGRPHLISEGETVKQWQVPLLVYTATDKSDSVIYWEMREGLHKLQFEVDGVVYWPHFKTPDLLNFSAVVVERSGNSQTHYHYHVGFRKGG